MLVDVPRPSADEQQIVDRLVSIFAELHQWDQLPYTEAYVSAASAATSVSGWRSFGS